MNAPDFVTLRVSVPVRVDERETRVGMLLEQRVRVPGGPSKLDMVLGLKVLGGRLEREEFPTGSL